MAARAGPDRGRGRLSTSASSKHQAALSHAGAEQRFKGGLADHSEQTATPAHRHPPAARGAAQGAGRRGRAEGLQHHRRAPALRLLLRPQGDQGGAGAGRGRWSTRPFRRTYPVTVRGDDRARRPRQAGRHRPVRVQVRRARQGLHHGPSTPRKSAAARTPPTPASWSASRSRRRSPPPPACAALRQLSARSRKTAAACRLRAFPTKVGESFG